ncbi:hypothetical protein OAK75_03715 [Bacteriovoracales bacterium]|nr:hypothetical protein [Bacteriovoracales bacterium]
MLNLKHLASQLGKEERQKESWLSSLKNARYCHSIQYLSDVELEGLALSCRDHDQFNFFSKTLYHHHKTSPPHENALSLLKESMAKSSYTYSDWIEAIEYFYSWLEKNGLKCHFKDIISYLNCINEFVSKSHHSGLTYLLSEMLTTYGFERNIES